MGERKNQSFFQKMVKTMVNIGEKKTQEVNTQSMLTIHTKTVHIIKH